MTRRSCTTTLEHDVDRPRRRSRIRNRVLDQLRTSDANDQPWAPGSLARQRQAQSERRALSQLRARSQGPTVEAAQRSCDVEAQSMPAAEGSIGAVESLEDGWVLRSRA